MRKPDLIDRYILADLVDANGNVHWEDIAGLPSAQPDRDAVTVMDDGTLSITVDMDITNVGRILLNQKGTSYGALYYKE